MLGVKLTRKRASGSEWRRGLCLLGGGCGYNKRSFAEEFLADYLTVTRVLVFLYYNNKYLVSPWLPLMLSLK